MAIVLPDGFTHNTAVAGEYEIFSLTSIPKIVPSGIAGNVDVPIILIHGAIVSHRYLMPVAEVLARDFAVYIPDLVGHGRSSKTVDAVPVKIQAEILHKWIETLGFKKVVLLANSYGCEVILEMAIQKPDVVESMIMTAPTADPAAPTVFKQAMLLLRDSFRENPKMGIVLLMDLCQLGFRRGFQTCQLMVDYDYIPRLPLATMPTLVVGGGKDPLAPRRWIDRVVGLLPKGKGYIIENGPHNVNFTTPDELAKVVTIYLGDIDKFVSI
jgi:2-hydroxy-6-oxonona-2,4-dienedioate hydrolase